jgi:sugar (pentulose or hexulose) kinase
LWCQILADVLTARIDTPVTEEGAAYGAGMLASVAAGHHSSVDAAAEALIAVNPRAEPGTDTAAYAEIHQRFKELYPALRPTFHATG